MPLRRHRVGLSKLKAKLDKLKLKFKKPVSPFVVVRLGSGRVQTKALRVGDIFLQCPLSDQPCLCSTQDHLNDADDALMYAVSYLQDCGADPNWSGSYHIDDVDPDAAQDLEVFVYDANTEGRELIGKTFLFHPCSGTPLCYYPFMAQVLHKTHA